jgi:hypothetical protein
MYDSSWGCSSKSFLIGQKKLVSKQNTVPCHLSVMGSTNVYTHVLINCLKKKRFC